MFLDVKCDVHERKLLDNRWMAGRHQDNLAILSLKGCKVQTTLHRCLALCKDHLSCHELLTLPHDFLTLPHEFLPGNSACASDLVESGGCEQCKHARAAAWTWQDCLCQARADNADVSDCSSYIFFIKIKNYKGKRYVRTYVRSL